MPNQSIFSKPINYQLLNSIIDCIYEAVCVVDEDGIVLIWNKSAENLYEINRSLILGKNIEEFFPNSLVNVVRKTGNKIKNKYHSPKKNSFILSNSLPLFINGQFKGAVSSDRDFAEIKNLSYQLKNAKNKLIFLENEVKKLSKNFGDIIGSSASITKKIEIAKQIAPTNASILITGESGTGKEVFARGIHNLSNKSGLFVPINCSAIPSELFESEFFGYSPGAFTGANKKGKVGLFELSNEGTIFLDEIADMPLSMQAKLLRVLQEKEITKVGGNSIIKLNLRIISATNKDLKKLVQENKFRKDLYYRLNVVEINLPSLKERQDDILLFVNHFISKFSKKNSKNIEGIQKDALEILKLYSWPGNIRELMNTIENMVVTSKSKILSLENIPKSILISSNSNNLDTKYPLDLPLAIKKVELHNIKKALSLSNFNKSKAAKLLNIPRTTLYHKIEEYQIECPK